MVVAFWSSCLLCAVYCWFAAGSLWPAIDGDGPAYFPAAVEWSRHHAFANPVWLPPLDDSIDGPGGRRYVYHGFLYQLVVGTGGRFLGAAPTGTIRAAYTIHWLAAVLSAAAMLAWSQVLGRWRVLLAALAPIAMLGLTVAWHGRMEPLAIAIVAAACLAWRRLPNPWRQAAGGAAVVLLGVTSPACGPLAGVALVAAIAADRARFDGRAIVAAVAGAAVAAAIVVVWYPYPIADWVGGVMRHSRINLSLSPWQGFAATWLTRPELPLLLVTFSVMSAGALAWMLRRDDALTLTAVMFWIPVLLFGAALWRLAFVKSEASYNAVVWVPLLASLAVANRRAPWMAPLMVVALALPAAGITRSALLLTAARQHTPPFADLQQRLARVSDEDLAISSGLWLAADRLDRVKVTAADKPGRRTFVVQQAYTGRATPPDFPGYRLTENHFGAGVTIFGVPISRTTGGWSYAVYERDKQTAIESRP